MQKIFLFIFIIFFSLALHAEIVYLKDGQVLKGAIVNEDRQTITIKTKYQTRKVFRSNITRILFGEREMEKVYIQFKDGTISEGYLVDQDSKKIIFRPGKKTAEEKIISKDKVKQISRTPIHLFKPRLGFRLGYLSPFISGKSNLNGSLILLAQFDFLIPKPEKARIVLEAGFSRLGSSVNKDLYFQMLPLSVNFFYTWKLTGLLKLIKIKLKSSTTMYKQLSKVNLITKAGLGIVWSKFDNGENEVFTGLQTMGILGTGFTYHFIKNKLNFNLEIDYVLLRDTSKSMGNIFYTLGTRYKY